MIVIIIVIIIVFIIMIVVIILRRALQIRLGFKVCVLLREFHATHTDLKFIVY